MLGTSVTREGLGWSFVTTTFEKIIEKVKKPLAVASDTMEEHGMHWTTLRGLKKVSMQTMLTFAAMNLKKLANWTWQGA